MCAIRIHDNYYSSRALKDPAGLEAMMERVCLRGPRLSPGLFTDPFVNRMNRRYRFAAVRAADGKVREVEPYTHGFTRKLLRLVDRLVPEVWRKLRLVFAFFILRPFDVFPAIFHRLLEWIVVQAVKAFGVSAASAC